MANNTTAAAAGDLAETKPQDHPASTDSTATTTDNATSAARLAQTSNHSTGRPVSRPSLELQAGGEHEQPAYSPASTNDDKFHDARETHTPPDSPRAGAGARANPAYEDDVNPPDFQGEVTTTNELPSRETLRKIENYTVLDRNGKTHPFKSLYTGRNCARRVLVIFVRHFFCGNCQEYLRALSASITPEALLRLPISTFITVVGCGNPALIDMYAQETGCPFPIYADPTRRLYAELGMIKTLALGTRPAYMSKGLLKSSLDSIVQGVKQIKKGLATKAGDQRQIGGEFLFEPLSVVSPDSSPVMEFDRRLENGAANGAAPNRGTPQDGKLSVGSSIRDDEEESGVIEEKKVAWCHRMKTTRDHAEIPELMEVLGLDGQGRPIKDKKRWSRALEMRKGTGLSMASQMSRMSSHSQEHEANTAAA